MVDQRIGIGQQKKHKYASASIFSRKSWLIDRKAE